MRHKRTLSDAEAVPVNSSFQPRNHTPSSQSRTSDVAEESQKLMKKLEDEPRNSQKVEKPTPTPDNEDPLIAEALEQTNEHTVPKFTGVIESRKNSMAEVFSGGRFEEEKADEDDSQLIESLREEGVSSPRTKDLPDTAKGSSTPRDRLPLAATGVKTKTIFDEVSEEGSEDIRAEKRACNCSRKRLEKILDNKWTVIWMTALTVYALFFDDFRIIFVGKDKDDIFFALSTMALFFFVLELILSSVAVPGYICAFFFWLDILATISIIPDIGWIWDPLLGEFTGANSAASVAKTSRASRAARIIRFVRLIRLIRLVKLYKQAKLAQHKLQERRDRMRNNQEAGGRMSVHKQQD